MYANDCCESGFWVLVIWKPCMAFIFGMVVVGERSRACGVDDACLLLELMCFVSCGLMAYACWCGCGHDGCIG